MKKYQLRNVISYYQLLSEKQKQELTIFKSLCKDIVVLKGVKPIEITETYASYVYARLKKIHGKYLLNSLLSFIF
jgi:hypothetical protein